MSDEPPLPDDLRAMIPPEARAAILAPVASSERRIAAPEARPDRNSSDPSGPPSAGPPHAERRPPEPTPKGRRGGRAGHERRTREPARAERPPSGVEVQPDARPGCGHALDGRDAGPTRHRVAELPEIRPDVVEGRLHRRARPRCGAATRAEPPDGVPRGASGPRLQARARLLGGAHRVGERQVRRHFADLPGRSISAGMIAEPRRRAGEAGGRFVERSSSAAEGRRRRGRGVAACLTACSQARQAGRPIASPLA